MFDPGPGLQHAATGKLTVLAVASAKRASRYPDVPTLEELGMRVDADTDLRCLRAGRRKRRDHRADEQGDQRGR